MKNLIFFSVLILTISSCDEIDPIIPFLSGYDEGTYGPPPTFNNASSDMIQQNVVIEDFTGHTCGNCPAAAIVAEDIKAGDPEHVILIAVHAGSFAETQEDHYTVDHTCSESEFLWSQLTEQFNPTGRVNRAPDASASFYYTFWQDKADLETAETPNAFIQMEGIYHPEASELNVHIYSEFLEDYAGDVSMVSYITESHIIGDQLDYSQEPNFIDDFEFNDVLRGSINGVTGEPIASNPTAGESVQNDYTFSFNSDAWVSDNCHIVAIVFDTNSGEILNASEIQFAE